MTLLRGVRDCKIRAWSTPGVYTGDTEDLLGVNQFEITDRTNEDQAEGDDVEIDYFSEAIGAEVRVRFFEETVNSLDVIALLTGQTKYDDGGGQYHIGGGRGRYRYVGLIAQTLDTEGVSDRHFFVTKAKVGAMSYTPTFGSYLIKDLTFRAVPEDPSDVESYPYYIYEHSANEALVIPPV